LLVRGRDFKAGNPFASSARRVTSAARPRARLQSGEPLCILRPQGDFAARSRARVQKGGPPCILRPQGDICCSSAGETSKGGSESLRILRWSFAGETSKGTPLDPPRGKGILGRRGLLAYRRVWFHRSLKEGEGDMYNGVKVLDVHGHVSSPEATSNYLMLMMAANTPFPNPLQPGGRPTPGLSPEDFKKASQRHVDYMDERNIDVQIIGPRPFRTMGFMEEHLIPNWSRFVND